MLCPECGSIALSGVKIVMVPMRHKKHSGGGRWEKVTISPLYSYKVWCEECGHSWDTLEITDEVSSKTSGL